MERGTMDSGNMRRWRQRWGSQWGRGKLCFLQLSRATIEDLGLAPASYLAALIFTSVAANRTHNTRHAQ